MKNLSLILVTIGLGGCLEMGGTFEGPAPIDDGEGPSPDASTLGEDPDPPAPPDAGPAIPVDDGRVKDGLAVLYKFADLTGNIIPDVSGVGEPLDLTIADPAAVQHGPEGLTVLAPTILSSERPLKVYEPCVASRELTIETWVTPATLTTPDNQPARIAGMSIDPATRNFSIVQVNAAYEHRVRTIQTNENGIPAVQTPQGTAQLTLQHIVYTRDELGNTMTYIDGVGTPGPVIEGSFVGWNSNYNIHVANEATLDRPWLGTVSLVAFYCRDLTAEEVAQNFAAGF